MRSHASITLTYATDIVTLIVVVIVAAVRMPTHIALLLSEAKRGF